MSSYAGLLRSATFIKTAGAVQEVRQMLLFFQLLMVSPAFSCFRLKGGGEAVLHFVAVLRALPRKMCGNRQANPLWEAARQMAGDPGLQRKRLNAGALNLAKGPRIASNDGRGGTYWRGCDAQAGEWDATDPDLRGKLQAQFVAILRKCPSPVVLINDLGRAPLQAVPVLLTALSEVGSFEDSGSSLPTHQAIVLATLTVPPSVLAQVRVLALVCSVTALTLSVNPSRLGFASGGIGGWGCQSLPRPSICPLVSCRAPLVPSPALHQRQERLTCCRS